MLLFFMKMFISDYFDILNMIDNLSLDLTKEIEFKKKKPKKGLGLWLIILQIVK